MFQHQYSEMFVTVPSAAQCLEANCLCLCSVNVIAVGKQDNILMAKEKVEADKG